MAIRDLLLKISESKTAANFQSQRGHLFYKGKLKMFILHTNSDKRRGFRLISYFFSLSFREHWYLGSTYTILMKLFYVGHKISTLFVSISSVICCMLACVFCLTRVGLFVSMQHNNMGNDWNISELLVLLHFVVSLWSSTFRLDRFPVKYCFSFKLSLSTILE